MLVLALGALAACGDSAATDGPADAAPRVELADFCPGLDDAACAYAARCATASADPATCRAALPAPWSECPAYTAAVDLAELVYDPARAHAFLAAVAANACDGAWPILVGDDAVFAPRQLANQPCHSTISCRDGLSCEGLTAGNAGLCTAPASKP